jgi:hypothetical protein
VGALLVVGALVDALLVAGALVGAVPVAGAPDWQAESKNPKINRYVEIKRFRAIIISF